MVSSVISKFIAAFALAVPYLAASAQCNLDKQAARSHAESQHPTPSPNYAAWLDQDVRWIITDEERASFKRLRSDEEREQFIQQFWLRRDPTPGTFLNEFKQEHYRRMLYANEHFAAANTPGWRTDRGRIYIVYGQPNEVTTTDKDGEPTERWLYRYIFGIGQEVEIKFADRCRCGDFYQLADPNATETDGILACIDRIYPPSGTIALLQFKDLDEIATHKICTNIVPVSVRTSQTKITEYTTLVPITVTLKDKDLQWKDEGRQRSRTLNIYGRVSTERGHVEDIFESKIKRNSGQAGEDFTFLYTATLRSGTYRIDVAVKDVARDRKGTWSGTITVP